MIIFDELEYAQHLLVHGFDNFMSSKELIILARYLKYIGKNEFQIVEDIHNFCYKHNVVYDREFYKKKTDFVFEIYKKRDLIIPNGIPITQEEIDTIKSLKNYKCEKVLFFLLVYAKHLKLNVGTKDYYANIKWTEIFTSAKVHVKLQEQYEIIGKLYDEKMIDVVLSGTNKINSFRINFINEEFAPIFYIDDFKNVTRFYPHYCSICGKQIIKKGNNHNMCNECWKEHRKEWDRNRKRQNSTF